MAEFIITPCTVADGPAIGRNNVMAFWTDKTWRQIWRGRTMEYVAEQGAKRGSRNLLLDRAHRRHLKAVNPLTGEVMGYARWVLPHEGCPGDDGDSCNALWNEARIPEVADEVRREADREAAAANWSFTGPQMDGIDAPIEAMQEKLLRGKRYIVLDYLCVPPAFRRRGIASALIRRGLEEAEKLGLDMFVLSMKAGVSVYQKAGFTLIDQVLVDASDRGGDVDYGGWFLERCVDRSNRLQD